MTEEPNRFAEMMAGGDFSGLFRAVLKSREAADRGEYCECPEPLGDGMSCGRCLRRSKVNELAAVHRMVDAHDYEPGRYGMCARCSCFEDAPRHHGEPFVGRTSWGDPVQGAASWRGVAMTEPPYRYFRVSDIVEPAYYRRTIGHVVEVLTEDGWRDTAFASVMDLQLDARDNDDTFEEITVVELRQDLDGGNRS